MTTCHASPSEKHTRTLNITTVVLVICIKGREVGEKKVSMTSGASRATWIRNTADLEGCASM